MKITIARYKNLPGYKGNLRAKPNKFYIHVVREEESVVTITNAPLTWKNFWRTMKRKVKFELNRMFGI